MNILRAIWSKIRSAKIKKKHLNVTNFWKPIISDYYQKKLDIPDSIATKYLDSDRIIWQYWGQGENDENLPEVVKLCFESVDKYKGDFTLIRLNDNNITEYLQFPTYLVNKIQSGKLSRTFFSDILRLALLYHYGGVWLDATILLSDSLPEKFTRLPYFMYQRNPNEENKIFWENSYAFYWGWDENFKVKVLNSVIFAKKGNLVIGDSLNLLMYYWRIKAEPIDYFFYQILYQLLIENQLKDNRCMIESDVIPHLLQTKFNNSKVTYDESSVLVKSVIHKMSYFDETARNEMKNFIKRHNVL